jgi:hypothetical protein
VIRLEGTVTYEDGNEQRIVVTQAEYAAFELWALRNGIPANPQGAPPMTMTRYLGYVATQRATHTAAEEWPTFEEWGAGAADVTLDVPEGADIRVPPTPVDRLAG